MDTTGTTIQLAGLTGVMGTSPALSAYLARPQGTGPWPGVVMVHEVWGINDVLRRQADHLAAMGYLVLAPNLYSAGGVMRCLVSVFSSMRRGEGRPFADIAAARVWLTEQAECTGKVGIIGFCMGGGFALMSGSRGFDVSAPFYGALPPHPDDILGTCPIVASYGGRDGALEGAAAKLERVLTHRRVPHDVHEYPDAGHSFMNDTEAGPAFTQPFQRAMGIGPEPGAARDAWSRIQAFFAEHLS